MNSLTQAEPFAGASAVVVLSPHCDDAAFSLAGLLHHCRDLGKPITVVTCFARSAYAPKVILKTTARVSRIRRQEDVAFADLLGGNCRLVWLDFPEAPLRRVYRDTDVCTSRPLAAGDLALAAELAAAFPKHLPAGALVLVPFGLGCHIDHRIVREAGLSLAAEGFGSLFLYEELPYAAAYSLPTLDTWVKGFAFSRKLGLKPQAVCLPDLLAVKTRAIRCYRSQAPGYVLNRILDHARRLDPVGEGAERVWRLSYSKTRHEPPEPMALENEELSLG